VLVGLTQLEKKKKHKLQQMSSKTASTDEHRSLQRCGRRRHTIEEQKEAKTIRHADFAPGSPGTTDHAQRDLRNCLVPMGKGALLVV
jgi:hypothetical protein